MSSNSTSKGTPSRESGERSIIALYGKAYNDYRAKNNLNNKNYLQAIQDALIAILGRTKFDSIKNRIKSNYSNDKIR